MGRLGRLRLQKKEVMGSFENRLAKKAPKNKWLGPPGPRWAMGPVKVEKGHC